MFYSFRNSSFRTPGLAALCLFMLGATASAAPVLYGVSSSNPGVLYTIDTATGAATEVVLLNDVLSFTGLEFLGEDLYVSDIGSFGGSFGRIDLNTGAVTVLSNQAGSDNWWGLAANEALGILYTIADGDTLAAVDTTGASVSVGATGFSNLGAGLAFDAGTSTLYALGFDGGLYTVDTSTGAATLVGATGLSFPNVHQGLAINPETGVLYMNDADGLDSLYTIDKQTGLATLVGPNGPVAGFGIDGLAFLNSTSEVPEPATFALVGLALVAVALRKRLAA